jgi:hypothetical protein
VVVKPFEDFVPGGGTLRRRRHAASAARDDRSRAYAET